VAGTGSADGGKDTEGPDDGLAVGLKVNFPVVATVGDGAADGWDWPRAGFELGSELGFSVTPIAGAIENLDDPIGLADVNGASVTNAEPEEGEEVDAPVGGAVGTSEGSMPGAALGLCDPLKDGTSDDSGATEGSDGGPPLGFDDKAELGLALGRTVGAIVGPPVGPENGRMLGRSLGLCDGSADGNEKSDVTELGRIDGAMIGRAEGAKDSPPLGFGGIEFGRGVGPVEGPLEASEGAELGLSDGIANGFANVDGASENTELGGDDNSEKGLSEGGNDS
jgi:hypothetical protein